MGYHSFWMGVQLAPGLFRVSGKLCRVGFRKKKSPTELLLDPGVSFVDRDFWRLLSHVLHSSTMYYILVQIWTEPSEAVTAVKMGRSGRTKARATAGPTQRRLHPTLSSRLQL